jgi:hypothetical protein
MASRTCVALKKGLILLYATNYEQTIWLTLSRQYESVRIELHLMQKQIRNLYSIRKQYEKAQNSNIPNTGTRLVHTSQD